MIELTYFVFGSWSRPDIPGPFYAWPMFDGDTSFEGVNSMMAFSAVQFGD